EPTNPNCWPPETRHSHGTAGRAMDTRWGRESTSCARPVLASRSRGRWSGSTDPSRLGCVGSPLLPLEFPNVVLITSRAPNPFLCAEPALLVHEFVPPGHDHGCASRPHSVFGDESAFVPVAAGSLVLADRVLAAIREPLERELDGVGGAAELGRAAESRIIVLDPQDGAHDR